MKKESQATTIVRLVLDAGADLWHTPAGDGYLTITVDHHREHHPLLSRGTRDYLTHTFYRETGAALNETAKQAAIATLSGIARFDGHEHHSYMRVAGANGNIYLDLGDPQWRAIEITSEGWHVIKDPHVRFRRTRGMLPLPLPAPGGSIAELRGFVNIARDDDYDFALVVCWLVQTFQPTGPYPALVLMGEQGTAKTTTVRVLRRMIDPNVADVRSEPREARDLAVAADNGHVIAFDNLSRLPEWLSDALCRLATGGGFSTRTLYENREEEIFEAVRPVVVNGITQVATRPDLLDRAMVVTSPVIDDADRRDEGEFWSAFEHARPRILGALLDAVVMALRCKSKVRLARKPRMADFALVAVAAEPACPWSEGTFLRAYTGNRGEAIEATLDGDAVADLIRALAPTTWTGTATELLAALNERAPEENKRRKDWFTKPRQVGDALRRLAPVLRHVGIDVVFPKRKATRRVITISSQPEKEGSPASPLSPSSRELVFRPDLRDEANDAAGPSSPSSRQNASISGLRDAHDVRDEEKPPFSGDGREADQGEVEDKWTFR